MTQPACFGPFRLFGPVGPLLRDGIEVPLRHKSVRVLWMLVSTSGEALSKEALMNAVWPGQVVADSSLSVCIREIRAALDDDSRTPRYVQTMHRHGYRFVGRVSKSRRAVQHTYFVGRHEELEGLSREFEFVQRGERRLVLVSGDAGLGKSALIETWCTATEASSDARIVVGRCLDQTGNVEAYSPFLDAIGRMVSGPDASEVLTAMRSVARSWLLQFPALISESERTALNAFARDVDAQRFRRELVDLLLALSADRPLVLVIEDMHWCDASSAAALAFLAHDEGRGRLLVVATFRRPDAVASGHVLSKIRGELRARGLCVELELGSLTVADVAGYVSERLGNLASEELASSIYRRTGGHSLFMATVVTQLAARGEEASPEALLASTIPAELQAFIELRLADLDATERRLLEAASIAGLTFSAAEVEVVVEGVEGQSAIEDLCVRLCRRGDFLEEAEPAKWPDGTLTGCYTFRHALFSEVTRGTLSNVFRARLHQRIGERLERGHEGETSTIAALLAYHFSEARDTPRAVTYLIEAAKVEVVRNAPFEAEELLRRGLSLVRRFDGNEKYAQLELDLLLTLGPVQVSRAGYGAAAVEETFSRARAICASESLADHRFPVLRGLAAFHLVRAEYQTAYELGAELTAGSTATDHGQLVEGCFMSGVARFFCGFFTESDDLLKRSFAHYHPQRHADHARVHGLEPGVLALSFEAITSWMLGEPDRASARDTSALRLAREVGHPFSLCQAHAMSALLHQLRGDLKKTSAQSDLASSLGKEHGFPYIVASERARRGWLRVGAGELSSGVEDIRAGVSLYTDTGAVGGLTLLLSTLAEAYLIAGDLDRGLETLAEALALAEDNGEGLYEAELFRLHGEFLMRAGGPRDLQLAEERLSAAVTRASRQKAKPLEVRAKMSLSRLRNMASPRKPTIG